jgi:hypothetical protein
MKTDEEIVEYTSWIWEDSVKQILPVLVVYAVLLIAYWTFVG